MSEMLERAYKALEAVAVDQPTEENLREYVRVIIGAMREPTPLMCDAAENNLDWGPGGYGDGARPDAQSDRVWRMMIDAVLA